MADPAKPVLVHVAGRTDVGLVREHNEDNLVAVDLDARTRLEIDGMRTHTVGDRGALLVVCDGMGGAAAGEVASQMAVDTIVETSTTPPPESAAVEGVEERLADFARRLRSAAFTANERIHEAAKADHARAGMGTTMTGVGIVDGHLVMAQVGDSRAYVLRGEAITQVTRDQSLVNSLLEAGQITPEQAALFEHSNVILQALGVQPDVEVQLSRVPLRRGDRVVVCSDGLTGVVTDEEMAAVLGTGDDVAEHCRLLVEMARAGGGPDNITVIVARCEGDGLDAPGEGDKVVYKRWRLDEPEEPPEPQVVHELPEAPSAPAPAEPPLDRAQLFLSSMLLLALALIGVIAASVLHRGAPSATCTIGAPASGLHIRVDGRDVGVRPRAGAMEVRLPPGRHRVALRGPQGQRWDACTDGSGAAMAECGVDVKKDAACRATFDGQQR